MALTFPSGEPRVASDMLRAEPGGQAPPGLGAILIAALWPKARSSSPIASYMFAE